MTVTVDRVLIEAANEAVAFRASVIDQHASRSIPRSDPLARSAALRENCWRWLDAATWSMPPLGLARQGRRPDRHVRSLRPRALALAARRHVDLSRV
jgi:hypothetical protein